MALGGFTPFGSEGKSGRPKRASPVKLRGEAAEDARQHLQFKYAAVLKLKQFPIYGGIALRGIPTRAERWLPANKEIAARLGIGLETVRGCLDSTRDGLGIWTCGVLLIWGLQQPVAMRGEWCERDLR